MIQFDLIDGGIRWQYPLIDCGAPRDWGPIVGLRYFILTITVGHTPAAGAYIGQLTLVAKV